MTCQNKENIRKIPCVQFFPNLQTCRIISGKFSKIVQTTSEKGSDYMQTKSYKCRKTCTRFSEQRFNRSFLTSERIVHWVYSFLIFISCQTSLLCTHTRDSSHTHCTPLKLRLVYEGKHQL